METIELELKKIILDYVKNNRPLDTDYLTQVILTIIKYLENPKLIKIIDIVTKSQEKTKKMAYIDIYTKHLTINLYKINEWLNYFITNFNLSPTDISYLSFIATIFIISHEIRHALQFEDIYSSKKDYETEILRLADVNYNLSCEKAKILYTSNYLSILKRTFNYLSKIYSYDRIYMKYYNFSPVEIDANNYGFGLALDTIDTLENDYDNLYAFFELLYLEYLSHAYLKDTYPALTFITKLGLRKSFEYISIPKNLDVNERLSLGLKITNSEQEEIRSLRSNLLRILKK